MARFATLAAALAVAVATFGRWVTLIPEVAEKSETRNRTARPPRLVVAVVVVVVVVERTTVAATDI